MNTNGVTPSSSGYVFISTTARRAYSGWLLLGGHRYLIHGQFDANGLATNTIRLSSTSSLTVSLQSAFGGDQIQGWVNSGANWWSALVADRLVSSRLNTNLFAGNYTMTIPPAAGSSNSPAGYGVATIRVAPGGTLSWSGKMANGTTVSQSSALSKDGYWPLYSFTTAGSELVMSWMQFTNPPNAAASGQLVWIRSAVPHANYYPAGFTNSVMAQAVRYVAPASGHPALDLNQGVGALGFSGGGLSGIFTNLFSLNPNNHIATVPADKLSLSLTPSSGWFNGHATDPLTRKSFSFQGVLNQTDESGQGFLLGPVVAGRGLGGAVSLSSAP